MTYLNNLFAAFTFPNILLRPKVKWIFSCPKSRQNKLDQVYKKEQKMSFIKAIMKSIFIIYFLDVIEVINLLYKLG